MSGLSVLPALRAAAVLALLCSGPSLARAQAPEPDPEDRWGFLVGGGVGLLGGVAGSNDKLELQVSPSRTQTEELSAGLLGAQLGQELGYAFGRDWRLLSELRLGFLLGASDVDFRWSLLVVRRLVGPLALRVGLVFEVVEAVALGEVEQIAGPGRSHRVSWEEQLEGGSLALCLGLEFPWRLRHRLYLVGSVDGVFGVAAPLDDPDVPFDDARSLGLQAAFGVRYVF